MEEREREREREREKNNSICMAINFHHSSPSHLTHCRLTIVNVPFSTLDLRINKLFFNPKKGSHDKLNKARKRGKHGQDCEYKNYTLR